ncbi:hypothetical protein QBC38DRAFT_549195 [Podospora fimiseda]|uniref:Peptidase A1 domain-containing protein n=1 Tax=Podospora fimiseda TaxID=252190 RepID=A0AAN6YQA7_9PEZI|nr:hypothetical protein QBC38DRAFT_549195 [Podospora fimiseda]
MRQQLAGPLLALAFTQQVNCAANVIELPWRNVHKWYESVDDVTYNSYKDAKGPWQAPEGIMMPRNDVVNQAGPFAVWPSPWTGLSEIPDKDQMGRAWAYDNAATPNASRGLGIPTWERYDYTGGYLLEGELEYAAHVGISIKSSSEPIFLNTTPIVKIDKWKHSTPSYEGTWNPPVVGHLALAPFNDSGSSILEQLSLGPNPSIQSHSFSLHMGSAKFNQSGSFLLGGYDQHRAVGRVRSYNLTFNPIAGEWLLRNLTGEYQPYMALQNLYITTEGGGLSPWADSVAEIGESYAGLLGSNFTGAPVSPFMGQGKKIKKRYNPWDWADPHAWVSPDPSLPDIYLPPGNCEHLAKSLPVRYESSTKRYIWNNSSPLYKRIMNSPTFLVFSLGSPSSSEPKLDIKIPFALLDIEVDPPYWAGPRTYFPCKSINADPKLPDQSIFVWKLGRAFLQGAYLSVDYGRKKVYLAQAVGPTTLNRTTVAEEGIHVLGEKGIEFTEAEGMLLESWKGVLSPLSQNDRKQGDLDGGLSKVAKVGIALGAVVMILAVASGLVWSRGKYWGKKEGGSEGGVGVEEGGAGPGRNPSPKPPSIDEPPPIYSKELPPRHSRVPEP